MKTKNIFFTIAMMAILCCCYISAAAQGNFTISGKVFLGGSGGVGVPNWGVRAIELTNTVNTYSATTNAQGNYTMVIAGGAVIGPNKRWEVSITDSCSNVVRRDTVQNLQGIITSVTADFELNSCQNNICGIGWQYTQSNQIATFFNSAFGASNGSTRYFWNFGDGTTSTDKNPIHTYQPGRYRACAWVFSKNANSTDFCVKFFCDSVIITSLNPTPSTCYSFEEQVITTNDRENAFRLYGDGNPGFLDDWYVVSGTPAIYRNGFINGVNAYDGSQYALTGVCNIANNWSEGVSLKKAFQQGKSYDVTVAIRNSGLNGGTPTPIDVAFVLLKDTIAFNYQTQTGCTPTPAIPSTGITVKSITSFAQNTWQLVTFNIPALAENYEHLWIRNQLSANSPLTTTLFLFDNLCIEEVLVTPSCEAAFYLNANSFNAPSYVLFIDSSISYTPGTGVNSWVWKIDNDTVSTTQNFNYTFTQPGTYNVCLIITTTNGCISDYCEQITITNGFGCEAAFQAIPVANNRVEIINNSVTDNPNSTSYLWLWGDGTTGSGPTPGHAYQTAGNYTICMYQYDAVSGCRDSLCMLVQVGGCEADFIYTNNGLNLTTVSFANQSTFSGTVVAYSWDFGDGSPASNDVNPVHTYAQYGSYYACLVLTTSTGCGASFCDSVVIAPNQFGCEAAFTATMVANNRVEFDNNSVSDNPNATVYTWTWGDGTDSLTFTPIGIDHIYPSAGVYTVCLYLFDDASGCRDTMCKVVEIIAPPQCYSFEEQVITQNDKEHAFNLYGDGNPGFLDDWYVVSGTPAIYRNGFINGINAYDGSQYALTGVCNIANNWSEGVSLKKAFQQGKSYDVTVAIRNSGLNGGTPTPIDVAFVLLKDTIAFNYQTQTGCTPTPAIPSTGITVKNITSFAQNTWQLITFNIPALAENYEHLWIRNQLSANSPLNTTLFLFDNLCIEEVPITPSCEANFTAQMSGISNLKFGFTNLSLPNNPNSTTYTWSFGDGSSSQAYNPIYEYTSPGNYVVCLTINDVSLQCQDTYCDTITVGTVTNCEAAFAYSVNGSNVNFDNNSFPGLNTNSYFWNFGDNTISYGVNPTHTYSVPGTYNVCLTMINNQNGCTDVVCQTIVIGQNSSLFCLSGKVFQGTPNSPAYPAAVYLIYNDTALGTLTAVRFTTTGPQGGYEFCNVPPGKYLVKAALTPNSPAYANYMPTYYGNSLFWNYATEVMLTQNAQQIDIWLIAGNNQGGPGFVGGYVSQGANKTQGPGDPLEEINVLLLDMFDNPVQYVMSDANGRWTFENVAYGTYKIWAEVAGKTTIPYIVTIGEQQPSVDDIQLYVETEQVISGIENSNILEQIGLSLFPNPTEGTTYLNFELETAADLTITITDITGKTVAAEKTKFQSGVQQHAINLQATASGVFFVKIQYEGFSKTLKVLKQ